MFSRLLQMTRQAVAPSSSSSLCMEQQDRVRPDEPAKRARPAESVFEEPDPETGWSRVKPVTCRDEDVERREGGEAARLALGQYARHDADVRRLLRRPADAALPDPVAYADYKLDAMASIVAQLAAALERRALDRATQHCEHERLLADQLRALERDIERRPDAKRELVQLIHYRSETERMQQVEQRLRNRLAECEREMARLHEALESGHQSSSFSGSDDDDDPLQFGLSSGSD